MLLPTLIHLGVLRDHLFYHCSLCLVATTLLPVSTAMLPLSLLIVLLLVSLLLLLLVSLLLVSLLLVSVASVASLVVLYALLGSNEA